VQSALREVVVQYAFGELASNEHRVIPVGDLPLRERPVERLHHFGPAALSTAELLASLVGGGRQMEIATALLLRFKDPHGIARASLHELSQIAHLGRAGAAKLKAALELGRRIMSGFYESECPQIRSPADAANLLMAEMQDLDQEHLRLILLDTKNRVLEIPTIYVGNLNTTLIRIGEVLRAALKHNAAGVLIAHNHPSGDPAPSPEDVRVTERMREAFELLDIECLDHIVIGQGRFVSLKERRLGFP
jgi:DNA repair protein RadC